MYSSWTPVSSPLVKTPLSHKLLYFVHHTVIYCPDQDDLVKLAGARSDLGDPPFNEYDFWKWAIGASRAADSRSSWYRVRVLELSRLLQIPIHTEMIELLNDVVNDLPFPT